MSIKQKRILYISLIVLVTIIFGIITIVVGKPLVQYAREPEKFREWINSFGIYGRFIFILCIFLQVTVSFIPGEPFEIAAGYIYGTWEGMFLCLIGITLGCTVIFLLVKRFSNSIIELFVPKKEIEKLSILKDDNKMRTLIFILNFIPGTPKDTLSYFVGLTNMKVYEWIPICFISRIPSVITSTIAGNHIADKNYLLSILVFVITGIIGIGGIIIYNRILAKKERAQHEN